MKSKLLSTIANLCKVSSHGVIHGIPDSFGKLLLESEDSDNIDVVVESVQTLLPKLGITTEAHDTLGVKGDSCLVISYVSTADVVRIREFTDVIPSLQSALISAGAKYKEKRTKNNLDHIVTSVDGNLRKAFISIYRNLKDNINFYVDREFNTPETIDENLATQLFFGCHQCDDLMVQLELNNGQLSLCLTSAN